MTSHVKMDLNAALSL